MDVSKRKAAEVYPFLEVYVAVREEKIADILQVVERYEKKRIMEERAYQTMSPLRRMLSGRKPDHHVAVEYIHYVKKPMEQVKQLRGEIEAARFIMEQSKQQELVELPEALEREMALA
jgi:acetyl-CoA carboxylase alpha subunit